MQVVKIYIETSLQGPCIKDGRYAVLMEYITQKGPATLTFTGEEEKTTYHRSVLLAAVKALQRLKPCKAVIYTNCKFIANMTEQDRPEAWKRAEWKNAKGNSVEHKDLWQQYIEEKARHREIAFVYSKHSVYSESLRKMLTQKGEDGSGQRKHI